jgi:hypothetical protein
VAPASSHGSTSADGGGRAEPRTWRRRVARDASPGGHDTASFAKDAPEVPEGGGRDALCVAVADPRGLFANRIWVQPGAQEIPLMLPSLALVVHLRPVDLPDGELLLSLEVRRSGRRLASCRVKGAGAARDVALSLALPRGSAGRRATLCVRSNAELHLQF